MSIGGVEDVGEEVSGVPAPHSEHHAFDLPPQRHSRSLNSRSPCQPIFAKDITVWCHASHT
eukprot:2144980-Rhodomonas_salina.2